MSSRDRIERNRFFPTLSHQVRQPINGVIEVLAQMAEMDLKPSQKQSLSVVQRKAHKLIMIINDILDLTRIEEGNFRLSSEKFDLRSLVQGIAERLAYEAIELGFELHCAIHPEIPSFVRGDAGRLRQAVENLVRVSIAHALKGPILIDLTLDSETEMHAGVRVTVSDAQSGLSHGITQAMTRAGSPYWSSASDEDPRACLQLTISRCIAEMQKGEFGIDRDDSGGASLWFTANLEKVVLAHDEGLAADLGDLRVLLVDDDETDRAELSQILQHLGCSVIDTEGRFPLTEILPAARASRPIDIIFISTRLHGQQAEDLGRALRQEDEFSSSALVFLTTAGRRGDAARLREIGFSAFLTRPVSSAEIRQTLVAVRKEFIAGSIQRIITKHTLNEEAKTRIRLLLVERDPLERKIIVRSLEKHGYLADEASDDRDAEDALQESEYDLVIADYDSGGVEIAKKIREGRHPIKKIVPVIGMYKEKDPDGRARCLAAGMIDAVSKPVPLKSLLLILLQNLMVTE